MSLLEFANSIRLEEEPLYLPEIIALRGRLGLPVERDLHFTATHPISVYARAARSRSGITLNASDLQTAAIPK